MTSDRAGRVTGRFIIPPPRVGQEISHLPIRGPTTPHQVKPFVSQKGGLPGDKGGSPGTQVGELEQPAS
jgi:hypothetical protein